MEYDIKKLKIWQIVGVICLLIVITGIVGWLFEFISAYFHSGMTKFKWKGGNFLPWINMYMFGAIIMFFYSYKYRNNPIKVFFITALSAGIFELITGYILDKYFGIKYWDYKNELLNIGGYTCLATIIAFGAGGLLLMNVLLPFLVKISTKVPKRIFLTTSILLCLLFLSDEIYNFVFTKLFDLPRAIDVYKNIKF